MTGSIYCEPGSSRAFYIQFNLMLLIQFLENREMEAQSSEVLAQDRTTLRVSSNDPAGAPEPALFGLHYTLPRTEAGVQWEAAWTYARG